MTTEAQEQLLLLPLEGPPSAPQPVHRSAVISPCGMYRYLLRRAWDESCPTALFVMLNPSTADAEVDDPTIRRCMGFARSWGMGSIEVVNLFALRATDPGALWDHTRNCVGEADNRDAIRDAVERIAERPSSVIVAAWGAHATVDHTIVHDFLREVPHGVPVMCLGRSRAGGPKHPLYLAANTTLEHYALGTGKVLDARNG